jgi:hypothetical protein
MFTNHGRKPSQLAIWKFTAHDRDKNAEIVAAPPFCGDAKKMILTPRTLTRLPLSARFDQTVHSPVDRQQTQKTMATNLLLGLLLLALAKSGS